MKENPVAHILKNVFFPDSYFNLKPTILCFTINYPSFLINITNILNI